MYTGHDADEVTATGLVTRHTTKEMGHEGNGAWAPSDAQLHLNAGAGELDRAGRLERFEVDWRGGVRVCAWRQGNGGGALLQQSAGAGEAIPPCRAQSLGHWPWGEAPTLRRRCACRRWPVREAAAWAWLRSRVAAGTGTQHQARHSRDGSSSNACLRAVLALSGSPT